MLVAAVAVMATAVERDAVVPVDRLTVFQASPGPTVEAYRTSMASGSDTDAGIFQPPASFRNPLQLVSLENWSDQRSAFDALREAPFGELLPSKPVTKPVGEPRQPASIDRNDGKADGAPPRQAPSIVKPLIARIQFGTPVLPPMAHTLFCLRYPNECHVRKIVFRGGAFKLTGERRAELEHVNAEVNRSIIPKRDTGWLQGEGWLISPKSGDCNDYAVTKRHDLIALGWPERVLLLSEVVTPWGEHHLVLVVRTSEGDLVADNLNPNIRSWSKAPYQWVRIQSPGSPQSWFAVANAAA
jgi:predicted transglutaminase-like cysteine proteinase